MLTARELAALPAGSRVVDKEHDDWVKEANGEWRFSPASPTLRSTSLAAHYGPLNLLEEAKAS